jgi:glycosyltransferase involved in cell wall biosynthesis
MRIAIDARDPGSVGHYIFNLSRSLLEADKDLELLLICNPKRGQGKLLHPRVKEVYFPGPTMSPVARFALGPYLRTQQFDIFHSPFEFAPRGLRKPLVVTVHDINMVVNMRFRSNNPLLRAVSGPFHRANLSTAINAAHRIVVISHTTRRALIEHAPWHEAKIRVVYNGPDLSRTYPLEADITDRLLAHIIEPGTPFVLTVGKGDPYKNHVNAVRGFLEAFGDRPEYRMILVRRTVGQDRALQVLLRHPQAQKQVLVLPYVSAEVLNALYNAARMLLHPSWYEGFGLPLVEAMAVGTPVVTSTVSAMPEVAGPAALLVQPADYWAIAEALVSLDGDQALRERLIAAGYKRVEMFHWSTNAQATLEVYRELA